MNARAGFTLVELIVAAVIGVLVAGGVTASLSGMLRARGVAESRREAFARADAAASHLALDLQNVVRHFDLTHARVAIVSGGALGAEQDEVLLLCKSSRPVRGDELNPEGDDFEVQYRVAPVQGAAGLWLWRRADPALDPYLDAGGVAAALVRGVASLSIQASNGVDWFDDWDSDTDGMPHAVRLVVTATSDDGRVTATARRLVAIDRVPIPPPEASDEETGGSR